MSLTPGSRIGSYEILGSLGAGGMGEVYRARDVTLNRDVALKVLPDLFANDPDRLTRFKREAQVLASLNHPNIGGIYGFEEANGVQALVLELVEGPTLADRIAQGPIPVDEALAIAQQIAEALEAAHVRGIVHRDLKPANLKLRPDGAVKVLDFGLAKAMAPESENRDRGDLSRSPTITTPAATRVGVIMGTAAYMSPEQARGQAVGDQTDIWAFGLVLYEMLTGKQAFTGETITDMLAAIVRAEPDWTALPEGTPASIRLLLRQCLQKNLAARLHHIADARIQIDAALSDSSVTTIPPRHTPLRNRALASMAAVGLLLAGGAVALLVNAYIRPEATSIGVVRFSVPRPDKATFLGGPNSPYVSISPDGRHLAFIAHTDGVGRIWVRSLDTLEARALAGTEGVVNYPPFWSPDSRFIGFFTPGKLRKIEVTGGPAQTLCDASSTINPSGTWNRDGVIVFGGGTEPLKRVPATGGTPELVTTLDESRQDQGHHWPTFLPDGDHFFFLARSATTENNAIFIGALSSQETRRVIDADSRIAYDPSGYLLFVREWSLLALPFDTRKLAPTGDPLVVAEKVRSTAAGQSSLTVSGNGVLAYRTGGVERNMLMWYDRSGKVLGTLGSTGTYRNPELSPDGSRVVLLRTDAQNQTEEFWVIDVARGLMTRVTFGMGGGNAQAVWAPTGEQLGLQSAPSQPVNVKQSSGAGSEEVLLKAPGLIQDWSSDGKFMISSERDGSISALPLYGGGKPFSYLQAAKFDRTQAQLSPDGRWLAYRSNESGRNEIYIQSFPTPSVRAQVSTDGGESPRWRGDGKEIFYLAPGRKLMVVSLSSTAKALQLSRPVSLFEVRITAAMRPQYDVTSDGQRFLVNATLDESETPVTVVLNWTAGLKK